MTGKLLRPFAFGKVAAHAGGEGGALDETGDLLVVEPLGADRLSLASNAAKQRSVGGAAKPCGIKGISVYSVTKETTL